MRNLLRTTGAACALAIAGFWGVATAQTPAPTAQATGPAVAAPTYTSIPLEIAVNRPAADVWKRVGKFCDIGEWLRIPCTITSGKDGEFGAVRSVASEVLVGKTELSYTYTQPVRERPAVQPVSRHARGAAGDGDHVEDRLHAVLRQLDAGRRRRARGGQGAANGAVHAALENMKILAEGGTLPPAPARGRGAQPRLRFKAAWRRGSSVAPDLAGCAHGTPCR